MPISVGKAALAALFAIPCAGCVSQNAMNLVPDSVRLEIAQQNAAKAAPVSVDQMLSTARAGAAPKNPRQNPALAADGDAHDKPSGKIIAPQATPLSVTDGLKPQPAQKVALKGPAGQRYGEKPLERQSAIQLFTEARLLHQRAQPVELDFGDDDPEDSGVGRNSTVDPGTWRKLLAQAQDSPGHDETLSALTESDAAGNETGMIPASLPDQPADKSQSIPVTFDEGLTALSKDDDLKIRLLRHGKRFPERVVIGKVEGAKGFQAMEKALAFGRVVAAASGGAPDISYDPALSARSA